MRLQHPVPQRPEGFVVHRTITGEIHEIQLPDSFDETNWAGLDQVVPKRQLTLVHDGVLQPPS